MISSKFENKSDNYLKYEDKFDNDDDEGVHVNKMRFLCVLQFASILILSQGL